MSPEGPGRRLSADEEETAAVKFALGASDRQVAADLGVGTGTANRLRHRLADRITELAALAAAGNETGEAPVSADDGQQDGTPDDGLRDAVDTVLRGELLTQLGEKRDELAERLADLRARALASRQALNSLDAERVQLLAEGKDAAPLRPLAQSARDDLADSETAAGIVRQQVAVAGQRIAEVQAEGQLAELRERLAPAVAGRDAAVRATGGRMAAAVLAVKAAAEEFTAALADEKSARERTERLAAEVDGLAASLGQPGADLPAEPESTVLNVSWASPGGGELALARAVEAARAGHAQAVAGHLAEAYGWLPLSRAEQAAELSRIRQLHAEMDRQVLAAQQPSQPWTRPDTASVGVDEDGREVRWYPGYRPPAAPHPLDAYHGIYGS